MPVDMENMEKSEGGQQAPAEFKPESQIFEETLAKIQGATKQDIPWLKNIHRNYERKAVDDSYPRTRRMRYSDIATAAGSKLGELGHPVELRYKEDQRLKYNV